jgi:sterol desaturase/sphingolipid hydroxylase (fatty acid hydroxylase superfamily)
MFQEAFHLITGGWVDPVLYAIPFFIVLMLVELYIIRKEQINEYELKDSAASIGMGLGSVIINLLPKTVAVALFTVLYNEVGVFKDYLQAGFWYSWVILFFLDDLVFYWHHRLSHEIRILWAAHVQHHSSEHYNLSTALRQSWTEAFYKFTLYALLALIGFHPLMILTQMSISLIYQFWIHTRTIKKLPRWVEFFMNTPSHHRVHHGSNIKYLDRNHAGILIIWDRMFGTFQEEEEDVIYGITENLHSFSTFKIVTHEYQAIFRDMKNAPTFADKIKYLLYPPGWSHTGASKTAKALQKEMP